MYRGISTSSVLFWLALILFQFSGGKALAVAGATLPFVEYEAEAGALHDGASIVALTEPPGTRYSSPELEASGHAFVQLGDTGQSVSWSNTTTTNFNVV